MRNLTIFLYEWRHLVRNPFKLFALGLFVLAGGYGSHNGATLYQVQLAEINHLQEKAISDRQETLGYFERGELGPEERPWVDVTSPFWALWYSPVYHFKTPSPAMVYSIGQAEQYGFYKRVTFWSTPYDADMAEEIANPERLQSGTLDFSFALLFLLPLLLMIFLYNIKGAEADAGFLPLVVTQTGSERTWLFSRVAFYAGIVALVALGLMLYGALLTPVFAQAGSAFGKIFFFVLLYLFLWVAGFTWIIQQSASSISATLKMVGLWLLICFLIPAAVQQWVSIQHPVNLMVDWIDVQREESNELYDLSDEEVLAQLEAIFPGINNSVVAQDSSQIEAVKSRSISALAFELTKESVETIEADQQAKNDLIAATNWFNPLTFFQNRLNSFADTHYEDYRTQREEILDMTEQVIELMVLGLWNGEEVNQEIYLDYQEQLNQGSTTKVVEH
ncbi:MAG: hypothetical protein AAF399_14985 [Bacteroidota bacterium]